MNANADALERELDWFARVLDARLRSYFGERDARGPDLEPPEPTGDSAWARFIRDAELPRADRLVLLLALVPHLRPQLLDVLWVRNEATQRGFTEFGGAQAGAHGGFMPTGETAAFLLAGDALAGRFELLRLLDGDGALVRRGVVALRAPAGERDPSLSGALEVSRDHLRLFTTGAPARPAFGVDFPARRVETGMAWSDLVLPAATIDQLEEIKRWIEYGDVLLRDWDMRNMLRPGFTCLFHGPSGTGKTLAASLLGKHCGCEIYKIDLSLIVSKYVGETEKNLARVFDLAEHRRWILFFDEADALFGKRTHVDDAHDRYANQEVSFLLQRIEEFDGVVILATNLKTNMDDAFLRRFQAVIQFPTPRPSERLRLWREALPRKAELDARVDLEQLSERFEITGGAIVNVVRHAALQAVSRRSQTILLADLEEGVRRELLKAGRIA